MYHVIDFLSEESSKQFCKLVKELLNNKKVLGENDKSKQGTEYDITNCTQTQYIKTLIEEVCSELYGQPLQSHNSWISISEPNTTVILHDHLDGKTETVFTAVLYVQAEDNCGELFLEYYGETIIPKLGNLVCFPAYCKHGVSLNNSSKDRICLAFDLKLNI